MHRVSVQNYSPDNVMTWKFKSPPKHRKPRARAKAAYRNMERRCENSNGKCPSYADVKLLMSLDEWLEWAIPRYESFIEATPDKSPCVSRYKDSGHYEIGNIEIISTEENRERQKAILLLQEDNSKLCSRCREVKLGGDFSKNKTRPDGLAHWCKECVRLNRSR